MGKVYKCLRRWRLLAALVVAMAIAPSVVAAPEAGRDISAPPADSRGRPNVAAAAAGTTEAPVTPANGVDGSSATATSTSTMPPSLAEWQPPPANYGMGRQQNVKVTMEDGAKLLADVYFPTDPATGTAAAGPFPVILTQSPYGKDLGSLAPPAIGGGVNPYFVTRGYIHIVADVRGTGGSEGSFVPFDPQQGRDGATLVRWAAALPQSSGRVGAFGASYLGIIQLFTAAEVGPNSPLQAIFPMVASNDFYRDVVFMGGIPNVEFATWFTAGTGLLNQLNPVIENPTDLSALLTTETQHLAGLVSFLTSVHGDVIAGGDRAYDGEFWKSRRPDAVLQDIVANDVAAFLVGGWNDLLQRGEPLNYSGLQNAYFGQPVGAPMAPGAPVTSRYQLLNGPWYHNDYGDGVDLSRIALQWFETWLRDQPTGMAKTTTPLHAYDTGSQRWVDTTSYPFVEATPTTYFLREGGQLSTEAPAAASGADPVLFTGVTSFCNRLSDWSGAGGVGGILRQAGISNPCTDNDITMQLPLASLTYTTPAFTQPTVLAGPIGVTLYATSNRPETMFVVTVEDIHPDGSSEALTNGALLGSHRALDDERTWWTPDGRALLPYHPHSRVSASPVTPGAVTRYDIEVFPTMRQLEPGHKLRLTITTGSSLSLVPPPHKLVDLLGGVYNVQRTAGAASSIQLPLASPAAFGNECPICR